MLVRYITQLWRGELPFARVFWTDMLTIGTAINIAAMIAALGLFLSGLPVIIGVLVHFLPVPYNALLVVGVSRSGAVDPTEWTWLASGVAIVWFLVMLVI